MAHERTKTRPALEDIAAGTCKGDVRSFLMGWIENLPKAWPQMSQREQENVRDACDRQSEALIRKVASVIAARGSQAFEVSVGDFNKKGKKLEAKISTGFTFEALTHLAEASEAGPIVLTTLSSEEYMGERAPAKVMKDQPDLYEEGEETAEHEVEAIAEAGDAGTDLQDAALAEAGEELTEHQRANGEALAGMGTLERAPAQEAAPLDGEVLDPEEASAEAIAHDVEPETEGEAIEAAGHEVEPIAEAAPRLDLSQVGETEQVEAAPAKRRRRTIHQISADNLAATQQEPAPRRSRRKAGDQPEA